MVGVTVYLNAGGSVETALPDPQHIDLAVMATNYTKILDSGATPWFSIGDITLHRGAIAALQFTRKGTETTV